MSCIALRTPTNGRRHRRPVLLWFARGQAGAGSAFYEQRSDLFPYVMFPFSAYALLVAGGLLLVPRPQIALDLVAGAMLVLLGIAIRNSWSIAITIVSSQD